MTESQYEKVPITDNEKEKLDIPDSYGYGIRHLQAFLFFMSLALGYISRGHLGVTIVAMTNSPLNTTAYTDFNRTVLLNMNNSLEAYSKSNHFNESQYILKTTGNDTDHLSIIKNSIENVTNVMIDENNKNMNEDSDGNIWNIYRTYDWPKSTQEMVQGSFFYGYFLMMFPTGLVVQKWGGKLPIQIALFVNGFISIIIPWLTAWGGWKVLCLCRLVQGLSQAGFYPAVHFLLANWVPVSERGTLNNYVYTGAGFGTIVAFQMAGVLADSRWGWPSTYWVTGTLCLFGFTILTIFGANKPSDYMGLSESENSYINAHSGVDNKKKAKTPWKEILTCRHVWACFSGHVGSGVSFVFFLTQVPTYMHSILHFNIKNSGLLSSLPYIFTFLSTVAFGHISDFCTNRKILSIKNARKISNTIGGVGAAVCIGSVSYTDNPSFAVFLFTAMLSLHSAGHTGWMLNYIDLAPNYSGALMATGNTLCNSMIISLPWIVSGVVTDVDNPYQWRVTFLLMAGLTFFSNAFYVLFMSTDLQSWNDNEVCKEPEEVKLEEHPEKK